MDTRSSVVDNNRCKFRLRRPVLGHERPKLIGVKLARNSSQCRPLSGSLFLFRWARGSLTPANVLGREPVSANFSLARLKLACSSLERVVALCFCTSVSICPGKRRQQESLCRAGRSRSLRGEIARLGRAAALLLPSLPHTHTQTSRRTVQSGQNLSLSFGRWRSFCWPCEGKIFVSLAQETQIFATQTHNPRGRFESPTCKLPTKMNLLAAALSVFGAILRASLSHADATNFSPPPPRELASCARDYTRRRGRRRLGSCNWQQNGCDRRVPAAARVESGAKATCAGGIKHPAFNRLSGRATGCDLRTFRRLLVAFARLKSANYTAGSQLTRGFRSSVLPPPTNSDESPPDRRARPAFGRDSQRANYVHLSSSLTRRRPRLAHGAGALASWCVC